MSFSVGQRIKANCETIWGDDYPYDLDIETDNVHYICVVKKDLGTSFGFPLIMTRPYSSERAAWAELDRMLRLWATQVKRGTPMTKDESLEIFGGSSRLLRHHLSRLHDIMEREGTKSA